MLILTTFAASKAVITSVTAGAIALGRGAATFTNVTTMTGSADALPVTAGPASPGPGLTDAASLLYPYRSFRTAVVGAG